MRVVFSRQAATELREIALFIDRDNKIRALSSVQELRTKAQQLADMPRAFPLVPSYEHQAIRRRPHRAYLIFYRIEGDRISILPVVHGARDHHALLTAEE